eukprot:1161392-Pelagomonas_calceolata.AAC.4
MISPCINRDVGTGQTHSTLSEQCKVSSRAYLSTALSVQGAHAFKLRQLGDPSPSTCLLSKSKAFNTCTSPGGVGSENFGLASAMLAWASGLVLLGAIGDMFP